MQWIDKIDIYVEFLTEYGDLPLMKVDTTNLSKGVSTVHFTISEYVKGTKEDIGQFFCFNEN